MKSEMNLFKNEVNTLDVKTIIVFLSSIILFTISWYFAKPDYFNDVFTFHNSLKFEIGELISFGYWFLLDTILFLVIPFIIIGFVFKEKHNSYGINFRNRKIGLSVVTYSVLVFIPIIYFVSNSNIFLDYFPLMQSSVDDFRVFIIYEILFIIFIFSWEFIFRGFILFGLEKKFGLYAIFIQMIPFVLLHNGKPFIETFASIFGALFLGYLAIRTRSISYGFLIHAIILVSLDLIAFFKA